MALPGSGRMTSDMIRGEFGGGSPMYISQFYRGGGRVPNTAANSKISTGGRIAHSMFYGARKEMSKAEVMADYINNLTLYSRIGDQQSSPYPSGWNGNYVWPFHKSGKPGTFDWTYNFDNRGLPAGDSSCTIALSQAGRGCAPPDIQAVILHSGAYISFNRLNGYSMNTNPYAGEAFVAYHAACDRRDIRQIVVRHYTAGAGYASCAQLTILPTNRWHPIAFKTRVTGTSGGRWGQPNTTSGWIGAGEVTLYAFAGNGFSDGVNVAPAINAVNNWYNAANIGIIVGDYEKHWRPNTQEGLNRYSINCCGSMILKYLEPGETAINYSRMSDIVSFGSGDLQKLQNWYSGTGGDSGTTTDVYGLTSPQTRDAELIDLVSWSSSDPRVGIAMSANGMIYANPIDWIRAGETVTFSATVTVRSRLFPSKVFTKTIPNFSIFAWYIQTGG